jgi:hypothetical protein
MRVERFGLVVMPVSASAFAASPWACGLRFRLSPSDGQGQFSLPQSSGTRAAFTR